MLDCPLIRSIGLFLIYSVKFNRKSRAKTKEFGDFSPQECDTKKLFSRMMMMILKILNTFGNFPVMYFWVTHGDRSHIVRRTNFLLLRLLFIYKVFPIFLFFCQERFNQSEGRIPITPHCLDQSECFNLNEVAWGLGRFFPPFQQYKCH